MLSGEENLTSLCDGTTKKGVHVYGVKLATDIEAFTASLMQQQ